MDKEYEGYVEIQHCIIQLFCEFSRASRLEIKSALITLCKGVETGFSMMEKGLLVLLMPYIDSDSFLDQLLLEK